VSEFDFCRYLFSRQANLLRSTDNWTDLCRRGRRVIESLGSQLIAREEKALPNSSSQQKSNTHSRELDESVPPHFGSWWIYRAASLLAATCTLSDPIPWESAPPSVLSSLFSLPTPTHTPLHPKHSNKPQDNVTPSPTADQISSPIQSPPLETEMLSPRSPVQAVVVTTTTTPPPNTSPVSSFSRSILSPFVSTTKSSANRLYPKRMILSSSVRERDSGKRSPPDNPRSPNFLRRTLNEGRRDTEVRSNIHQSFLSLNEKERVKTENEYFMQIESENSVEGITSPQSESKPISFFSPPTRPRSRSPSPPLLNSSNEPSDAVANVEDSSISQLPPPSLPIQSTDTSEMSTFRLSNSTMNLPSKIHGSTALNFSESSVLELTEPPSLSAIEKMDTQNTSSAPQQQTSTLLSTSIPISTSLVSPRNNDDNSPFRSHSLTSSVSVPHTPSLVASLLSPPTHSRLPLAHFPSTQLKVSVPPQQTQKSHENMVGELYCLAAEAILRVGKVAGMVGKDLEMEDCDELFKVLTGISEHLISPARPPSPPSPPSPHISLLLPSMSSSSLSSCRSLPSLSTSIIPATQHAVPPPPPPRKLQSTLAIRVGGPGKGDDGRGGTISVVWDVSRSVQKFDFSYLTVLSKILFSLSLSLSLSLPFSSFT
jgi:hypothetical protein